MFITQEHRPPAATDFPKIFCGLNSGSFVVYADDEKQFKHSEEFQFHKLTPVSLRGETVKRMALPLPLPLP